MKFDVGFRNQTGFLGDELQSTCSSWHIIMDWVKKSIVNTVGYSYRRSVNDSVYNSVMTSIWHTFNRNMTYMFYKTNCNCNNEQRMSVLRELLK
jgi:hypothetical protein